MDRIGPPGARSARTVTMEPEVVPKKKSKALRILLVLAILLALLLGVGPIVAAVSIRGV